MSYGSFPESLLSTTWWRGGTKTSGPLRKAVCRSTNKNSHRGTVAANDGGPVTDPDYTLGDLEARKREIRERLQREGLFELNRQLPTPWDYNLVLVVAPEGGAGLGDFQAEARRIEAFGICRFVYVHSRFQGDGAAAEIRTALLGAMERMAGDGSLPDAVAIIRGGGAINDMAWLNDYALVRTVCELEVPVLTGIGHERDNTVLDEVANIRFDTPSKVIAGIFLSTRDCINARRSGPLVGRISASVIHLSSFESSLCSDCCRPRSKSDLTVSASQLSSVSQHPCRPAAHLRGSAGRGGTLLRRSILSGWCPRQLGVALDQKPVYERSTLLATSTVGN